MDENYIQNKKKLEFMDSKLSKSIKMPAMNSHWEEMYEFLKLFVQKFKLSNQEIAQVLLVGEEIFTNISKYAYPNDVGNVELRVEYNEALKELKLHFEDNGIPFNPCLNSDPNIMESSKDRKIGGLGLYIVRQIADSIKYENIDGKNQLTILKKINKED